MWAHLRPDPRIKLQSQGSGARLWILERPIFNRVVTGHRPSRKQISAGFQWRPNAFVSGGGFSVYRAVFRANPADFFGRGDKAQDLLLAQDSWLIRQFA